jgi:hypothetical protein
MKKRCAVMAVVLVLLVAFGAGQAQQGFHGVLYANHFSTVIDSVVVVPPDTAFLTAGWQGQGTTYDTFDFPDLASWPTDLRVYGVVSGQPAWMRIVSPVGRQWYPLGMGGAPYLMFYGEGVGAVEESKPAVASRQCLTVSPSVLTGQMTVRLRPAQTGRPVVRIHDALGNVVRSLDCAFGADGVATATWNREDDRGHLVPEGIYFCRYAGADVIAVRKVLVAH